MQFRGPRWYGSVTSSNVGAREQPYHSLERRFQEEELSSLLVLANFAQRKRARLVAFLAGCWSWSWVAGCEGESVFPFCENGYNNRRTSCPGRSSFPCALAASATRTCTLSSARGRCNIAPDHTLWRHFVASGVRCPPLTWPRWMPRGK